MRLFRFFDKLEDYVRTRLARHPIIYALLGGVGVVLFWRGVWMAADSVGLSAFSSIVISLVILLLTGLFVSFFVGDAILISGLKKEKKLVEKTESEVLSERDSFSRIEHEVRKEELTLRDIKKEMEEIKRILNTERISRL